VGDEQHLEFATREGRVLVGANQSDFMMLHRETVTAGNCHAEIVIASQSPGFGERIRRLVRLAAAVGEEEMRDRIEFLSDWGDGEE
jgi:hypothetical protein